ncbi:MAG: PLP-dependent aminotransferase family protein [Methanoregula sp.]|nr:PLP-dependent aminotransferase family protein [Methanoregula sp.]
MKSPLASHNGTSKKQYTFAPRMARTPKSFIREILKVTQNPDIISFAGGLPNPALIDVEGIARAAARVLAEDGRSALQYSTTEGYLPLRQFIADRYKKRLGLSVSPEEILITNGSQQCLDLIGKVFINSGDSIAIERPGYLGAIQAFSLYEPVFHPVNLNDHGPDPAMLRDTCRHNNIRLFYGVPNSQNPSGISYSEERRKEIAGILKKTDTLYIEDDAYGELNFSGKSLPSMRKFLPDQTIITGSFSKILAPGMRLGWIVAPVEIMEQIIIAKQASDLHSNYLSQRIAGEYLQQGNIEIQINKIQKAYKNQCKCMLTVMAETFSDSVTYTQPQGGMFVWITLPDGCSSLDVFEAALKEHVAVLPGTPFYVDGGGKSTMRLNFSNSTEQKIITGIRQLAQVIKKQCEK